MTLSFPGYAAVYIARQFTCSSASAYLFQNGNGSFHAVEAWHGLASGSPCLVDPRGVSGGGLASSSAILRPTLKFLKCCANSDTGTKL